MPPSRSWYSRANSALKCRRISSPSRHRVAMNSELYSKQGTAELRNVGGVTENRNTAGAVRRDGRGDRGPPTPSVCGGAFPAGAPRPPATTQICPPPTPFSSHGDHVYHNLQ